MTSHEWRAYSHTRAERLQRERGAGRTDLEVVDPGLLGAGANRARADLARRRGEPARDLRRRLTDHCRHVSLEDARLFTGDRLERRAEVLGVIEPDRRHPCRSWKHHVRRIESSTEAGLDQSHI